MKAIQATTPPESDARRAANQAAAEVDALIEAFARAIEVREREAEGHSRRVANLTVRLGRLAGVHGEDLRDLRHGALLHDIGQLRIPEAVLFKTGALTEEEWTLVRQHPVFAYEMLSSVKPLRNALQIPYCHHEKWDGSGYPYGLKGDLIPLPARIFAVVDVWDSMTSPRPYRQAWSSDYALGHLRTITGTHLDPDLVKICLESGILTESDA